MMFSRIGLWAFDLCQLKELQLALADHPRRNSLYVRYSFNVHCLVPSKHPMLERHFKTLYRMWLGC